MLFIFRQLKQVEFGRLQLKKLVLGFAAAMALFTMNAGAQVLDKAQVKNTFWTGVGNPFDGDFMCYGFTDVIQARIDSGKMSIDAMFNMGALANYQNKGDVDNFQIGTTNLNPLALHYGRNAHNGNENTADPGFNNSVNSNNTIIDAFYVNFLYHINRNFDFGLGTKLNWGVGPAPRYGDWVWAADAHVRQGGFSTAYDDRAGAFAETSTDTAGRYRYYVDRPGSADVVGFVPYANSYGKRGMGVRFISDGDIDVELGAVIPNGFNTDDPALNFGAKIGPAKWLSISAAMEGAFEDGSNFYSGVTIDFKTVILDAYLAMDSLFTSEDDDEAYATGAAVTFVIPNTKITLRPEIGLNFFENDDYTMAWFTGAGLVLPLNRDFQFSVYGSAAFGSKDKRWDDDDETDDYDGGKIFTARPAIKFFFSKKTTFDAYLNLEKREAFDGKDRSAWSTGLFVTHIF